MKTIHAHKRKTDITHPSKSKGIEIKLCKQKLNDKKFMESDSGSAQL